MTTAFHFCFRRVQVNQDGLKLHGTQLLVYVDDVKILDGSVHTMQKNTEDLVAELREQISRVANNTSV